MIFLIVSIGRAEYPYPITLNHHKHISPPLIKSIRLPHRFLTPNSETVMSGGIKLMREVDYEIAYLDGTIYLSQTPEDTVTIEYEVFPLNLRKSYYHREYIEIQPESPESLDEILKDDKTTEKSSPFNFTRSGSIFRTVTVGSNRDASLESGMDLKVRGRLGKGTTVTAALSDQNIPLQPEGDTRTLEEIDKVYVKVESDNYALNLGDYDLAISGSEFASLDRKLTGAQISANGQDFQTMISGATSDGEFRSQSFNGLEGLQGPYFLTGKRGETGILVLAGSEKVWLDGLRLTRGDDYDYIIDYSRGDLTFTEKNPIDSDSRIVVDFQYSSGDYNRSLYHSTGKVDLFHDKIELTYAAAHESDNRNNPLAISLTPESEASLKYAGDNQQNALLDGGEYAGPGLGDYLKIANNDTSFYYIWAGRDSGDYDVSFSFTGYGSGSYTREFSLDGDIFYEYVEEGNGEYLPVILLPLPKKEESLDIGINFYPSRNFSLKLESAASRYDRNTFSALDDADNNGSAFNAQTALDSLTLPGIGGNNTVAGISLRTRYIDDNFHSLDRTQDAEYNRKWGFTDTLSRKEQSYDLRSYILPVPNLKISLGNGALRKDNFQSRRWDSEWTYRRAEESFAQVYYEDIEMQTSSIVGFWRRGKAHTWMWLGNIKPAFSYEGENQSSAGTGFRFDEYQGALKFGRDKGLLLEHSYREDDQRQNSQLAPVAILNRSRLNYTGGKNYSNYTVDFSHSERNYLAQDSADVVTDLGRFEFDNRSQDGFSVLNFKHRITQSQTAETALIPLEVGWGEGNYVKEGDQYFPDSNGNYLLVSQPTGNYLRSAKVISSMNLRLDFRKLSADFALPDAAQQLSTETYLAVSEENTGENPWKLYLLYLPAFRSDSTLYGSSAFRQDFYYRKGDRDYSLRFRFADNRSLNNRLVSAGERLVRDDYAVRLWKSLTPTLSIQTEFACSVEKKWLADQPDRNLHIYTIDHTFIKQIDRSLEMRMNLIAENAEDAVDNLRANTFKLRPILDYSIISRGRITLDATWIGVFSDADNLPYEMTKGNGKGSNYDWSARASYRLGKNLNLTVNYTGEAKIGRPVIHTGRMELRAFF